MEGNQALLNEALKKLFNAIAARDGIRVVFDQECTEPHASSSRVVTMPPPSAVEADRYWFYAMHERGHLLEEMEWSYTELGRFVNAKDELSITVANILVDHLDELNFYGMYEGVDLILDKGRQLVYKEYLATPEDKIKANEANVVGQLFMGLIMYDAECRHDWMGAMVEALPFGDFNAKYNVKVVEALKDMDYRTRIASILHSATPARDTGKLVDDILAIIGHKPPPPEGGEGEGEGEGDGEGQGEGKGSGKCSECKGTKTTASGEPCPKCDGTGECQACKGEGEDGDGTPCEDCHSDTPPTKHAEELWESQKKHDSGIGMGHDTALEYRKLMKDHDLKGLMDALDKKMSEPIAEREVEKTKRRDRYYGRNSSEYIPWVEHKVLDCEKDFTEGHYRANQRSAIQRALGNSTVSKQISKYLKALVSESYTYGLRRGKLHQKAMHKMISQKPQRGVQPTIYKKRNSTQIKMDSAVTIQLDCSGSMSGSKFSIGAACCVAISDTLTSLGIPHEILGFTEHYGLTSYVFKNFGTTLTKEKLLSIMSTYQVDMCQNADGESVLWAAERLLLRKESNKLHVVLSDGMPAGCFSGDGNAYLKHVCQMIEEQTKINLVGIGICTRSVERFYKHNVVVNDPGQLDAVLFTVLRDFLV